MKTKRAKALKPVIMMYGYPGSGLTIGMPHLCIPLTPASKRAAIAAMVEAYWNEGCDRPIPPPYFKAMRSRMETLLAALESMASPTE